MYKAPVAFAECGNLSVSMESERCFSLKDNANDRKYNVDSVKNLFFNPYSSLIKEYL